MTDKPAPDVAALLAEMKHLREDFTRMGEVVEELVRGRAHAAADKVGERAEKAWAGVHRTAESASHTLEQNPMATLGGAFGLGLLFGMLFSGRH
jgi:ElaB/YqjD/DUF883 family membrane-anchored ribosome-binding protein